MDGIESIGKRASFAVEREVVIRTDVRELELFFITHVKDLFKLTAQSEARPRARHIHADVPIFNLTDREDAGVDRNLAQRRRVESSPRAGHEVGPAIAASSNSVGIATRRDRRYSPKLFAWASGLVDAATP